MLKLCLLHIQEANMLSLHTKYDSLAFARTTFTGGKRVYVPGSFGPLVPVAEPGSITWDQCRSRFQHEPGPIGLHVDAL
jgi:hypothetical protein